jgi:carboxylesterase
MSTRVVPGAEPFRFDGGRTGVLLLHGFTGSPASMRPMGEYLAANGLAVNGPRLPGHGTTYEDLAKVGWPDWEREAESSLAELNSRCERVVVAGLSMGGGLAILMGSKHPEELAGVVVINPYVRDPRLALAPIVRLFMRSAKGVGNDIKKPGQDEVCYDRIPTVTLVSLAKLLKAAEASLPRMTLPLLVFSSPEDHTIKPSNAALVMDRAGSPDKEQIRLTNSYHVATLDYDAPAIFDRTLKFATNLAEAPRA